MAYLQTNYLIKNIFFFKYQQYYAKIFFSVGFVASVRIKQESQGLIYAQFLNSHLRTIFLAMQYKAHKFLYFVWVLLSVCPYPP